MFERSMAALGDVHLHSIVSPITSTIRVVCEFHASCKRPAEGQIGGGSSSKTQRVVEPEWNVFVNTRQELGHSKNTQNQ